MALTAGAIVASGLGTAGATQATGDDAAAWTPGWSWTYASVFHYVDSGSSQTDVTINENVTYTNAGVVTYNGQSAYQVNLTGTITGGGGSTQTSQGKVTLKNFSGTVSGTEYVRRSDLAMLQESQHQNLNGTASLSIISTGISAVIDMTLTPNPGWKSLSFPLNAGDTWHENTDVAYTGGFSYDAGSLGGTGSSPFDGTFPFQAPASVSAQTISVPINGSLATDAVMASSADGSTVDNQWWSPGFKNVAKEHLQLPLDTATLTIDRSLSSVSTPAPAATLTETITPSLTCAGAAVTVAGRLSTGASGVPLTITLDESADTIGATTTTSTSTGTNGNYSATVNTSAANDRLTKNGARGTFGVVVEGGSATQVATVVVTPQDCTALAYTGATSAPQGATATVSATLTDLATPANAAGRTISFALSGGATVTGTTNASGVATATLPVNGPPRSATVTASLAASSSLAAATTSAAFAVTRDPTTTAVVATPPSVTIGDPVTFTATVTPGVGSGPTGTVQFTVDGLNFGAPVALSGGSATSSPLSTLALGNHSVTATYTGDANFAPSTSPTITVRVHNPLLPTTTTLVVTPDSAVFGQPVSATATVAPKTGSGDPTGTVTFTEGGTTLGTAAVDPTVDGDQATLTLPNLPVGSHPIVATYSSDDVYAASSSTVANLTVSRAATKTTVTTPDTSTVTGQAVGYTGTVTALAPGAGVPTGSAVLRVDGTATGSPEPLSGGVAVFPPVTSLTAGPHTITVSYDGDDNFAASSGSTPQTVAPAQTTTVVTTSPSPSAEDQTVTITASVTAQAPGSGAPTGTVTFTSDGDPIGAATLAPTGAGTTATLAISTLPPGSHSIVATYAGDANYVTSTSDPVSQTVTTGVATAETVTTLDSSVNPSTYGQLISFSAAVSAVDPAAGTPSGAVQFSVDGVNVGGPVTLDAEGRAQSAVLASPDPGDHTVIAAFLPDTGFSASGAQLTQQIADAAVQTTLVSSDAHTTYGQGVSFTATVASTQLGTGNPTGLVQFRIDNQPLGGAVPLTDGVASSPSISTLSPGTHTVTAVYSGDVDFLADLVSITQTVDKIATTTALTATPASTSYGHPVTLSAVVTPASSGFGAPAGTVTFTDGSTTLGTVPVAASGSTGTAALTVPSFGGGSHSIKAAYSGAAIFAGSTSAATAVTITRTATTLSAAAALVKLSPLGLPLGVLKATLTSPNGPVAGQPIVFTIGATTVCTTYTDASGQATCNALAHLVQLVLYLGYKAAYAGNSDYLPSNATGGIIK